MGADAFDTFVDYVEQELDKVVVLGSDEELFIASYLHGHFSLAVSQILQSQQHTLEKLSDKVNVSLQDAFDNKELERSDQQKVVALWSNLLKTV